MNDESLVKAARPRILSLILDWLSWAYLLYGGFTLHYLATRWSPYRPEEKFILPSLTLPQWGLVALGIIEMGFLCQAFGVSLGQRALGQWLRSKSGDRPDFVQRFLYFSALNLGLLPLGFGIWFVPKDRSWAERWAEVRLMPLPAPGTVRRRRAYLANYGVVALLLVAMTLALGIRLTEVELRKLFTDAPKSLRIWRGIINPDFRYLISPDPRPKLSFLDGLIQSLYMALLATVCGAALAFPLSFLGARNIAAKNPIGWFFYVLVRGFFNIFRGVEVVYWASIFAIWVGFGPFAGTLALLIHTIAALGKLFSEQVEHIDPGPVEAVTATGANILQVVRYAVIPQVIPQFLAFTIYRWDINLRMATVVGLVGGGGIGRLLFEYKDDLQWRLVGGVIVLFMITVWIMDYVSGWVRERIT